MKYMLEYKLRHGADHNQNMEHSEALTLAFSKWKPENGLTVHAFVAALGGGKGYALVEADDPQIVSSLIAKFAYWNDMEAIPVIDIGEAVPLNADARRWAQQALKT